MIRKILFTFLTSLTTCLVYAQYPSNQGRFEVAEKSGCAPFTVNITIVAPSVCDAGNPCDMDWNGDNSYDDNLVFTHTYTQPGSYWLQVLFQASGVDSIQIEVLQDIPPAFEVYTCGGNSVQYNVTDTNYDQYVVDFNDGSPVSIVPSGAATGTHTYALAGPQAITVRGRNLNAQDNCTGISQAFNAVATLPAPFIDELIVLDPSQIQLNFTGQNYIQYRLEVSVNNNPFQLVQMLYNTSTVTVPNLQPDNNFYCFRLGAFDPCTSTTAYSNVICSSNFDVNVQSDVNILNWITNNSGVADYSLQRDNTNYLTIPANQNTANDQGIVCKTTYTYQLVTNYSNGSRSYSLQKSGTAFSTTPPTPVQNITAVVDENLLLLEWDQEPGFAPAEYSISKSTLGYAVIGTTASQTFIDNNYSTEEATCYRITYTDLCDNESEPSNEACPIQLTGSLQDDNSVLLNWSAYSGWQNGVLNYTVEKYTQDGILLQSFDAGSSLTLTDDTDDPTNQIYVYVVKANAADPALNQSVSNTITIIKDPNIFYPSAFTPNGDGLNDNFHVYGQYVSGFRMLVYNRWGELIFVTTNMDQGWDGTFNGKVVPEGTYVFNADLTDLLGRTFNRSGSVLLLRKK
jgi:gliding motility-associated-like protein